MTQPRKPLTGLFVAGTDTGVGKTLVSAALLRHCARSRITLLPSKPAESGCSGGHPADAAALLAASGHPTLTLREVCPFPLRRPVAPAAAAHRPLRPAALVAAVARVARRGPVLVESAGGLLSPYTPRYTCADLAAALGLPVLLVARNALGTINHTALAVAELKRRRIDLLALLLVTTTPSPGLAAQKNAALIAALTGVQPIAVPHFPDTSADRVADFFVRSGTAARLLVDFGLRPRR